MSEEPLAYIRHIAEECAYILTVSNRLSKEEFLADETLKRAIIRSLEVIGEAAKKVPADFRKTHPAIQWKNMAGMRDHLIHNYIGINYLIVWDVVETKIPELNNQVQEILNQQE